MSGYRHIRYDKKENLSLYVFLIKILAIED